MEIWRDILELNSMYAISNKGRVKRKSRKVKSRGGFRNLKETIKPPQDNGKGYKQLYVQISGKRHLFYIHRLVAIYFIENPLKLDQVNHKDGIKSNNLVENLEWCDQKANMLHAKNSGLMKSGENHSNSKLKKDSVLALKRLHRINPKFNKRKVGIKLGVSDTTIHKIVKGERWLQSNLLQND